MKLLFALLLCVGCGNMEVAPEDAPAHAAETGSGLIGTWTLVQDGDVAIAAPCQRGAWCDVWTFAADGNWTRDVQGNHYAGKWSADAAALRVVGDDGSVLEGPYTVAGASLAFRNLRFTH